MGKDFIAKHKLHMVQKHISKNKIIEVPDDFNWEVYLELNSDIKKQGFTSEKLVYEHYDKWGKKEGRPYLKKNDDSITQPIKIENNPISQVIPSTINISTKIAVYTSITGGYDALKAHKNIDNNHFDYICFTDNRYQNVSGWKIREIPGFLGELEPAKRSRCIKILPHLFLEDYDISIWIDGSITIIGDLYQYIRTNFTNCNLLIAKHPDRNCIYQEAGAVINLKKDEKDRVNEQMGRYKKEHFPSNFGLTETGIIIRKHMNPDIIKFGKDWWNEVLRYSKRDQLSFEYVHWKTPNVEMKVVPPIDISSKIFHFTGHNIK